MKYEVLGHASIRIEGTKVLYIDPYRLNGAPHDADFVFVTHDHYDHFSPEDVRRVSKTGKGTSEKESTVLVTPGSIDFSEAAQQVMLRPGDKVRIGEVEIEAIPAYNIGKTFHPREKNWLGYVITLDGLRYYVAGDTDHTPEAAAVECDVAFLPVGGTYTCDVAEAAALARAISPRVEAVPMHFGTIVGTADMGDAFRALLRE